MTTATIRDLKATMPARTRERSLQRGLQVFAAVVLGYGVAFGVLLALPWWWARLVMGPIVGLSIGTMFVIGHEAAHGALTTRSGLNRWLARIAFAPSLQPLAAWEHTHNVLHHGWTNLRGKDPAFAPMTKAEFDELPRWRQRLERVYRSPLGIGLFYFMNVWWEAEFAPRGERRRRIVARGSFQFDRFFTVFWLLLEVGLAIVAPPHTMALGPAMTMIVSVLLSIVWPAIAFFSLLGFFTFQQHTHPRVAWYDDEDRWTFYRGQIRGTIHMQFPAVVEFVLNDIMQHTAHHVDPKIPIYHLVEAQRALERQYPEDILIQRWSWRGYVELFRVCQLYDYSAARWLSFEGDYTSDAATRAA